MQYFMCSEDNEGGSGVLVCRVGGGAGGRDHRSSWGGVGMRTVQEVSPGTLDTPKPALPPFLSVCNGTNSTTDVCALLIFQGKML